MCPSPEAETSPSMTDREQMAEKRNALTSIFMAMLIAVAFQEMVSPVRIAVREHGLTFDTLALFGIFFLTSIRFFIGNHLHLVDPVFNRSRGRIWLYDHFAIVCQSTLLIFLGGVSSLDETRKSPVGFFWLLIWLYVSDVLWIASQWLLAKCSASWRRPHYPWPWLCLNTVLIAIMLAQYGAVCDIYSDSSLALLLLLNAAAFVVDVVLTDEYHVVF